MTAAEPSPARATRMTAGQRKDQIIEVAISLFGRHGFKGTTTKALATAAGVSEATIFKYFPTKVELYASAFAQRTFVGTTTLVSELQACADRQDDEGLLRRLFSAILSGYEIDQDLHRMLLYAWLEQDLEENRLMASQMFNSPLFSFLPEYVRQRQASGAFAPGAIRLIVAALLGLGAHHAIQTKLHRIDSEHDDEETATTFARLMLYGLKARS